MGRSLVFKVCLFTGPSVLFFINRSMGKEIKSFIETSFLYKRSAQGPMVNEVMKRR